MDSVSIYKSRESYALRDDQHHTLVDAHRVYNTSYILVYTLLTRRITNERLTVRR